MHAFRIPQLTAQCVFAVNITSNLADMHTDVRAINDNLGLYSPEVDSDENSKYFNFMDCVKNDGYLNIYLLRLDNNEAHSFIFGNFQGQEISVSQNVGIFKENKDFDSLVIWTNAILGRIIENMMSSYKHKDLSTLKNLIDLMQKDLKAEPFSV